jgi:hypothetical protein
MDPFTARPYTRKIVQTPGNFTVHSGQLLYLPHPSGRCRIWNQAASVHRARALVATYAPGFPWGTRTA